jgi:hypothetical protein
MLPITGVYAEILPHISIGRMLWLKLLCVRADRQLGGPSSRHARRLTAGRQSPLRRPAANRLNRTPHRPLGRGRRRQRRSGQPRRPGAYPRATSFRAPVSGRLPRFCETISGNRHVEHPHPSSRWIAIHGYPRPPSRVHRVLNRPTDGEFMFSWGRRGRRSKGSGFHGGRGVRVGGRQAARWNEHRLEAVWGHLPCGSSGDGGPAMLAQARASCPTAHDRPWVTPPPGRPAVPTLSRRGRALSARGLHGA